MCHRTQLKYRTAAVIRRPSAFSSPLFITIILGHQSLFLRLSSSGSMRLHAQREITRYNEMNDQTFSIDMNI
jgi:hypothetical protein